MDADLLSFTAYFPMPIRHGMTVGELAQMFNAENHLGARLHVIKMRGYERTDWFDETGQAWVNPSPNLRNLTEEILYPGVCLVEDSGVSLGRGTDTPFEMVGAPWIDGRQLAAYLNSQNVQGVRFLAMDFTPRSGPFDGTVCHGVQVVLIDREALEPTEMGVELLAALWKLYPTDCKLDGALRLLGSHAALESIRAGENPQRVWYDWQGGLQKFRKLRAQFLLYP